MLRIHNNPLKPTKSRKSQNNTLALKLMLNAKENAKHQSSHTFVRSTSLTHRSLKKSENSLKLIVVTCAQ